MLDSVKKEKWSIGKAASAHGQLTDNEVPHMNQINTLQSLYEYRRVFRVGIRQRLQMIVSRESDM